MRTSRVVLVGVAAGWLTTTAAPSAGMGVPIVPTPLSASPWQSRSISGSVTDSVTHEGLVGAQVRVAGTTFGTLVRGDGKFTLNVPLQAVTLQIRALGHKPRDVQVAANQSTVDVALGRDNFRLEEVVISGQATGMEKKNLATAVGTVDADQIAAVPAAGIDRALQGKVTGAHISENSGAPGGGSIVRIRGVTTIIGQFTPLYVVDGVIVSDEQLATGTNFLTEAIRNRL